MFALSTQVKSSYASPLIELELTFYRALSRELDAKKKLLDGVEHSVQKMTQTKLSWKTKLTMKDDEVADLRVSLAGDMRKVWIIANWNTINTSANRHDSRIFNSSYPR